MILEPIMSLEVVTPDEFIGDVISDINRRRGRIGGQEPRGNTQVIAASVPLAEMFGYATDLRSRSQGRATFTMQFSHYEPVPKGIGPEALRQGGHARGGLAGGLTGRTTATEEEPPWRKRSSSARSLT